MSTPTDAPNPADLTQLVRYVLTIDNLHSPECLGRVRQVLMGLGLIVDQVHPDGTEVAATHVGGPGIDAMRAALAAAGYHLAAATTVAG